MNLTDEDQECLDGRHGPGARMAMSILARMGQASGAGYFIKISAAHIDSSLICIRLHNLPEAMQRDDLFYALLGILVGKAAGDRIPVIDGLRIDGTEDQSKAFCAAVTSAGGVALFHIVGLTPEAPILKAACQGKQPQFTVDISVADVRATTRTDHHAWRSIGYCCPWLSTLFPTGIWPAGCLGAGQTLQSAHELLHRHQPRDESGSRRSRLP